MITLYILFVSQIKVDGLCYLLQEIYGIENKLNQKSGKVCANLFMKSLIPSLSLRFWLRSSWDCSKSLAVLSWAVDAHVVRSSCICMYSTVESASVVVSV